MLGDTKGDWRAFRKFTLPGTDLVIEKTSHGEHHMSSQTIEFMLPFELGGRTSWFTTNGTLSVTEDGRYLYLWDATVVIRVDLATREACNYRPPQGAYISSMEIEGTRYRFTYYGSNPPVKEQSFTETPGSPEAERVFAPGLGPLREGLFPSAWEPSVRSIEKEREETS